MISTTGFSKEQLAIRQQDAGLATWDDLAKFLVENGGATNVVGSRAQRFELIEEVINPIEDNINALRMPDGRQYACGDTQGPPVFTSGGGSRSATRSELGSGDRNTAKMRFPVNDVRRRPFAVA